MEQHKIASRDDWQRARIALLDKEKAFTDYATSCSPNFSTAAASSSSNIS
jgi:predicted dithiol-disulfide oxidoreductase (DUF899 family)